MKYPPYLYTLFVQEGKEVFHSKLLWLVTSIYIAFFMVFVLVGTRESAIMGFTGMNRVLFSWSHALVFFLPLLALTATSTVITQYRENGLLEFFLSQPISRKQFFLALTLSRFAALFTPLFLLVFFASITGVWDSGYRFSYGVKFILISTSLIWCFLSIGLYLSEKCRNQVRAIVLMILVWVSAVIFIDIFLIGLVLEYHIDSVFLFFLTELNPIQATRLALLMELDSSLSTLGPIGFFVANKMGTVPVFLIGLFSPLVWGTAFWFFTRRNFNNHDIV